MSRMDAPVSREELEHNINLLLEKAKYIGNASEDAIRSFMVFTYPELKKLRKLPNGRVDLHTIDESLRLNANSQNFMESLEPFELGDENETQH